MRSPRELTWLPLTAGQTLFALCDGEACQGARAPSLGMVLDASGCLLGLDWRLLVHELGNATQRFLGRTTAFVLHHSKVCASSNSTASQKHGDRSPDKRVPQHDTICQKSDKPPTFFMSS